MKGILLTYLLFAISLTLNAQSMNNREVTDFLLKENLDSLINRFGKERAVNILIRYNLTDTINAKEIWYSESAIDTLWMHRSFFKEDFKYVSLKIKSIYWIYLIFKSQIKKEGNLGVLIESCSGNNLYDYEKKSNQFAKVSAAWISEIQNHLEAWSIVFDKKGLNYLQEKNLSPLNPKYSFQSKAY
jgi:hypothetical protein